MLVTSKMNESQKGKGISGRSKGLDIDYFINPFLDLNVQLGGRPAFSL